MNGQCKKLYELSSKEVLLDGKRVPIKELERDAHFAVQIEGDSLFVDYIFNRVELLNTIYDLGWKNKEIEVIDINKI